MSLLQETVAFIKHLGQSTEDIIFIGSELSGHSCTWEEFCTLANFKYDNDSGSNEVPMDLLIVFFDMTKLFREECGGSEWWGVHTPFKMPENKKPILRLKGVNSFAYLEKK